MLLVIEKAMFTSVEIEIQAFPSVMTSRGSSGQVAFEELEDLGIARAPTRFRAFPDDTGIAF
jgi:hypothetical protein